MRKILMIIIILLFVTLGYVILVNGIQIGNFQILSIKQIEDQSQNLKAKIEKINNLIDVEYPRKYSELKTAGKNLESSKEKYLQFTTLSTDAQILEAMQKKSYAIEFLWAKIGTHARNEGINLKLEILSSSSGTSNLNDLKFTANGSYIAITNFIYALENDTNLNFRIENFKLLPNKDEILQATFTVRNIAIEGNTSTQTVEENKDEENTKNTNTTETDQAVVTNEQVENTNTAE